MLRNMKVDVNLIKSNTEFKFHQSISVIRLFIP